jgi:hypothetical protein
MIRFSKPALVAALASVLAGMAGGVSAATAKLEGIAFDVYYDDAALGLFGTPTLSGDMLFFTPTQFKAESLNGLGVVTASSTLNLRIELNEGYDFASVALLERGDYRMRGASSEVDVLGQLRVFDVAAPLNEATDRIASAAALDARDGLNYNWTASAEVGLTGTLWSDTRMINVTIENLLDAYTDPLDAGRKQAFVEKKFVGLSVGAVPAVPEPESYALMLAGLGMLGLVARRRAR